MNYIYLIQLKEFMDRNIPIYKISKAQDFPKKSLLILQSLCLDSNVIERNIIQLFTVKYINRRDIGLEYFEGDVRLMINDINSLISEQLFSVDLDKMVE